MARAYQSPRWQHYLSLLITLAIYVYPLFLFLQYPNNTLGFTRLFILFPMLYLFFLFAPTPDTRTTNITSHNRLKPLLSIIVINSIFFFISQTLIPSLLFIATETTTQARLSLNHEWLALWALFSLYTGISHHFAHREHKAPLASAALYAGKKSYATIVLTRIFAMFASLGNFLLIYFLLSTVVLLLFRLHGPLAMGFNPILLLGFLLVFVVSTLLVARFSRWVPLPFRLQNRYYLLIAIVPSAMILYHFYILSLPYLHDGLIQALYQAFAPVIPTTSMIILSQYGFFLLAMPFASGFILRFTEHLSTKIVFILTMAPILAFYDLGSLPINTSTSSISILIALIGVLLGTRQKTTADFLMGPFSPPRQRYLVVNRSSKLFFSHLIGPTSIVTMTLNVGLQPLLGLVFVAGTALCIVTLINIIGFYGRTLRLNRF